MGYNYTRMKTAKNNKIGGEHTSTRSRKGSGSTARSPRYPRVDQSLDMGHVQVKRLELRQPEAHKGQLSNLLNEPLLNADEAAQLLHVPRSTLYELVRSRHLPHVRMGRSLRFTRVQLARWVDENTFR